MTNTQVAILTSAPGLSPLEVEQYLTFPVEMAMNGVPGLRRDPLGQPHRRLGGDGHLQGRHRPLAGPPDGERAAQDRRGRHPARLRPPRARRRSPPGSARSTSSIWSRRQHTPMELRTMLDWDVSHQAALGPRRRRGQRHGRRGQAVPGGPRSQAAGRLPPVAGDVQSILERNNAAVGGGYIEKNGESFSIRGDAQFHSIEDIENTVVTSDADGTPGAGQEPGRRSGSARRSASAPSPSTARARSSRAR